ncbi:MAG TPA: FAD-binding domain [Enteractinococcus sp.]
MRVLIVGAGIAGPTLAYWLHRAGHQVTLIESAPQLRQGGYIVDFWGAGFDVAERMGIVPRLMRDGYVIKELREVSAGGWTLARVDPARMLGGTGDRYVSIARSELSAAIYDCLDDDVETVFGDTVIALDDDGQRVRVEFKHSARRDFDLVFGADGLHSKVRSLVFGSEADFENHVGLVVCALELEGYRPRNELIAVTQTTIGVQTMRSSLRHDATLVLFTFRDDRQIPLHDVAAQQEFLRTRLGNIGGEVPGILEQLPQAKTFYMDRASQIRMPDWSRGRVALLGDAAAAPSLLAGQGSPLAMVEAYVLAVKLRRRPNNHQQAFAAYQQQLQPMIQEKQNAALGLDIAFAPANRKQLFLRNATLRLMGLPVISKLLMGHSLRDPIELPDW